MPCTYIENPNEESRNATQKLKELHTITRLACDHCQQLERHGKLIPSWAREWWTGYKAQDAIHLAKERKAKETASLRRSAINKLAPDERRAIGL